jgi:RNA polymerase sigma factor (sigma-70 family)
MKTFQLEELFKLISIFRKNLNNLTIREQKILQCRFDLPEGYSPKTLEETGKEFGITRERVRQIENKALMKMEEDLYNYNPITISELLNKKI